MNKRLKKKKHHSKRSWQWHMMRVNDDRLYRIAKLCLSSIYGKCVADDIMMGGD